MPFLVPIIIAIAIVALLGLGLRTVRIIPQARVGIIQRLGNYNRTAESGVAIVFPFIDKMLALIDLREQVVSFASQPVITADNVTINVGTVIYYQILDAKNATYQVANLLPAVEQLTQTTLRNIMGGMALDTTLTSRDEINARLRMVLDEVTEKWGVRVNRVELKDITPPKDIQLAMEKQMQAERSKRAAILNADGEAQSSVLRAEGQKKALILQAEGQREAAILKAEGDAQAMITLQKAQAEALDVVFRAVNEAGATPEAMQYQYMQMLPRLADNPANKIIVVPSEMASLAGLATSVMNLTQNSGSDGTASAKKPAQNSAADLPDKGTTASTGNGSDAAALPSYSIATPAALIAADNGGSNS